MDDLRSAIRLAIPIVVGILFSLSLTRWNPEGLWSNLTTELIGILIVVLYIDYMIRQNDKKQWEKAKLSALLHLQWFIYHASVYISNIIKKGGFIVWSLKSPIDLGNTNENNVLRIKNLKENIKSLTVEHFLTLSFDQRNDIREQMKRFALDIETLTTNYGKFLNPSQLELLFTMSNQLKHLERSYAFLETDGIGPETNQTYRSVSESGFYKSLIEYAGELTSNLESLGTIE